MKVSELITHLRDCDPDAQVHHAYPSGDHWRTELAPEVTGVDEGLVEYSEYHQKPKLVDQDDIDADPCGERDDERDEVVILR